MEQGERKDLKELGLVQQVASNDQCVGRMVFNVLKCITKLFRGRSKESEEVNLVKAERKVT